MPKGFVQNMPLDQYVYFSVIILIILTITTIAIAALLRDVSYTERLMRGKSKEPKEKITIYDGIIGVAFIIFGVLIITLILVESFHHVPISIALGIVGDSGFDNCVAASIICIIVSWAVSAVSWRPFKAFHVSTVWMILSGIMFSIQLICYVIIHFAIKWG